MAARGTAWSVKGIDRSTRDLAREGARATNSTIGEWIDEAIRSYEAGLAEPAHAENVESNDETITPTLTEPGGMPESQSGTIETLRILDEELDASRSRLDVALRPAGFALRDIALKLVAIEQARQQAAKAPVPTSTLELHPVEGSPQNVGEPRPPAEIDLSEKVAPSDIPVSGMSPERLIPEPPIPELVPAPIDPANDFAPDPVPPVWDFPTPVNPYELEPTGTPAMMEEQAAESARAEPSRDDQEYIEDLDDAAADPFAEPLFDGSQDGFESHPELADVEATVGRKRSRARTALRVGRWLVMAVVVVATIAVAGFLGLADKIGLEDRRDALLRRVPAQVEDLRQSADHLIADWKSKLGTLTSDAEISHPPKQMQSTASSEQKPAPRLDAPTKPAPKDQKTAPVHDGKSEAKTSLTTPPATPSGAPKQSAVKPSSVQPSIKPAPAKPTAIMPKTVKEAKSPPGAPKRDAPKLGAPKPPPIVPSGPPAAPGIARDVQTPPASLEGREAIAWLDEKARQGNAKAQHDLAIAYAEGKAVTRDFTKAANWFREAAIQGVANAQYNLAVLYERGMGLAQDNVRALLWYHSAAEQDHPMAQYNLGIYYAEGRGIPKSLPEAKRWFVAAADQGVAEAHYNLAIMAEEGLGIPVDRRAALASYRRAAALGDKRASARLKELRAGSRSSSGAATGAPIPDAKMKAPKPGLAGTVTSRTGSATNKITVIEIQKILAREGLYPAPVDGIAGPQTRRAIRDFERKFELPITGIPSANLLKRMRAALATN